MTEQNTDQTKTRLNIGAGKHPIDGWDNLDAKDGRQAYPLEGIADSSVDEIRASHILEHFPFEHTQAVLSEWVRVLKPGGVISLAVPDLDKIVDGYVAGTNAMHEQFLVGGHVDPNDAHQAVFNRSKLTTVMRACGLIRIEPWVSDMADAAGNPISLNLRGTKITPRAAIPRIFFALSCPRVSFTTTWMSVTSALQTIPGAVVHSATGAYWGQCLERTMRQCVDEGAEYIITLDYDSVFDPRDVAEMIYLAESYPEADAIAPMQQARGWDRPLMCVPNQDGKIDQEMTAQQWRTYPLCRAQSAHFGLSLFRAASLKKFPHPWFLGKPNEAGEWGDGRQDDDIAFWHKWNALGLKLYMAPRVVVGHIIEAIAWPNESMETAVQTAADYRKNGKPKGVWR